MEEACLQTSIKDHSGSFEVSLSPNPVNSHVTMSLDLKANNPVKISIYNTTGLCISNWQFTYQQTGQKEFQLDLKDIQTGIYFCRIQAGDEVVSTKIIKL